MALVNKESVINKVVAALKKCPKDTGVEILSYKRNRGVAILKEEEDRFWLRERGYEEQEMTLSWEELPRALKSLVKREFPRSRKLRIFQIRSVEELAKARKRL